MSDKSALARRRATDMALMPPPPVHRSKRPAIVLDEDDYTNTLADIIARDYFPGLAEAKAQEEYLAASESNNSTWIEQAGKNLLHATEPHRSTRGIAHATQGWRSVRSSSPRAWYNRTPAGDTPDGNIGGITPSLPGTGSSQVAVEAFSPKSHMDGTSLSQFQANHTSEDNESFNAVLDKQNLKRRERHAYLWTPDQRIPSKSLITQRANEAKPLAEKNEIEASAVRDGRELIPITTGAIASRPAKPDSWRQKNPTNSLMFQPESIEDSGVQTIQEAREAASKAGPKEIVFANTRFPPHHMIEHPGTVPPSPSLNTSIIARRDARRANSSTTFPGNETPRVNGYSFVDDEEDDPEPPLSEPSYRDLLAGQTTDLSPNPFKIHDSTPRESLHHRLVEKDSFKKRRKQLDSNPTPSASTPGSSGIGGNMTPAAKRLMERLGRTPMPSSNARADRMSSKEMWTPGATPRRTARP